MPNRIKIILIGLLIVVVAAVATLGSQTHTSKTDNVTLLLTAPDSNDLAVSLDDDPQEVFGDKNTFKTTRGQHHLIVSKPGYKTEKVDFATTDELPVVINLTLKRTSFPILGSWQEVQNSSKYAPGAKLADTPIYFYDNTWALITISASGSTATSVVHYDDTTKLWRVAVSPGTYFTSSDLAATPNEVRTYMQKNHYVSGN